MSDHTTPASDLDFEAALARLDEIARALEDSRLGLNESLATYEEGVKLLRHCQHLLTSAERRIEIITGVDAAGNPITKPFDDTATYQQSGTVASEKSKSKSAPSDSPALPKQKRSRLPRAPPRTSLQQVKRLQTQIHCRRRVMTIFRVCFNLTGWPRFAANGVAQRQAPFE